MVQRIYNRFDLWIKQDNTATFAGSPSFIDGKNINWLVDWQGITLWPKVNKVLTTTSAIRWIDAFQLWAPDFNRTIIWWDNWDIYKFDSVDNTPEYTITWENIIKIDTLWNDYIIFTKSALNSANTDIYKISRSNAESDNWASLATPLIANAVLNAWVTPTLVVGSDMFIGSQWQVVKFDGNTITDTYNFPDDYVTALTLQWSTIAVYVRTWNVYFWDWWSATESARGYAWSRVEKSVNLNGRDYLTCEDGQLKQGSYTQFWKIFKPKNSFRLEDNTILQNKLDFALDDENAIQNHTSITALDDLYFYGSDSIQWIYRYWSLISWTWNWIHKIITQNHEWTQIDTIYDMYFYERTDRRIYFAYKADTTYWVDYIDLDDLESCNEWYWVTEIFTWWTAFKKKLNVVRMSVSNIDEDKTASLYYRINNQEWVLLRTINSATEDIYYRDNIYVEATWEAFQEFIDIQFKVELDSTTNDNKPPMLNELMIDYTIIEA